MNTDYSYVRALPAQSARVANAIYPIHPIHVCNGYGQHTIRKQTNASTMSQQPLIQIKNKYGLFRSKEV